VASFSEHGVYTMIYCECYRFLQLMFLVWKYIISE